MNLRDELNAIDGRYLARQNSAWLDALDPLVCAAIARSLHTAHNTDPRIAVLLRKNIPLLLLVEYLGAHTHVSPTPTRDEIYQRWTNPNLRPSYKQSIWDYVFYIGIAVFALLTAALVIASPLGMLTTVAVLTVLLFALVVDALSWWSDKNSIVNLQREEPFNDLSVQVLEQLPSHTIQWSNPATAHLLSHLSGYELRAIAACPEQQTAVLSFVPPSLKQQQRMLAWQHGYVRYLLGSFALLCPKSWVSSVKNIKWLPPRLNG